jgi:hypothetical protein
VVAVYAAVFGVGALITGTLASGLAYCGVAIAAFALIQRNLRADPTLVTAVETHVDVPEPVR